MAVKELEDFVYLANVVQDKYASRCTGQATSKLEEKKALAGVPSLCRKKSLLQQYLRLSVEFQKQLLEKRNECSLLDVFSNGVMEARSDTECTYTDDSFVSMMQMHTELMTDSIRSRCSQKLTDLNVLLKCSQAEALKKMLLCGLSYNKLLEDHLKRGEFYVTSTTCHLLAEYQHCMIEVERSTGCTKSELHRHTSTVLNYWTWNVAPLCESAAPWKEIWQGRTDIRKEVLRWCQRSGANQSPLVFDDGTDVGAYSSLQSSLCRSICKTLLLSDNDPKCDSPKSLYKALNCGKQFQEYAEQTTWDSVTFSRSCSSLETLDTCLQRAMEVKQCKQSLGIKTQVSLIKAMLMSEYTMSCKRMHQFAPRPVPAHARSSMRWNERLVNNYSFGDGKVRTKLTEERTEASVEDEVKRLRRIAAAKRLHARLGNKLSQPLRENIKAMELNNVIERVKNRLILMAENRTSTPVQSNNTNLTEVITSTSSSVIVIPVVGSDDSLCDTMAYERESQRCHRYITDKANHYYKNMRYVPLAANPKGLRESICKTADYFRACLSDVAERHRCLVMLANMNQRVERKLATVGLAFCTSSIVDSGSSLGRDTFGLTVVLVVGTCWSFTGFH